MQLIAARFVDRPRQFLVRAELEGRRPVLAHLADPGRLRELLVPGASLRLRPVPPSPRRRTRFTVSLVRSRPPRPVWVGLETVRANRLAAQLLEEGRVGGIGGKWSVLSEVVRGRSRFDFQLEKPGWGQIWVEVKSVTLVRHGRAQFPDAPTRRGAKQVQELISMAESGHRGLLLFVVQRSDARSVSGNPDVDPVLTSALVRARRAGVLLRAARFHLWPDGRSDYRGPLPVKT